MDACHPTIDSSATPSGASTSAIISNLANVTGGQASRAWSC